jgi:3'-5' exoribonuclease
MLLLNPNDRIENQPVIVRQIVKKVGQNNKEYYHLQVSCGIKSFDAKIWNGDEEIVQEITPGCFANIWGIAKDFKGNLQIHINKIERIQDPDDELVKTIVPSCELNEISLCNDINKIIDTVNEPKLNELLMLVFNSPEIKDSFYKRAGGIEIHHAYVGGLAQHTVEVAKIVIGLCSIFDYINYDLAVTAALLHDIGKTVELSDFPENKYTDVGRLLGHISLGAQIVNEKISSIVDFPQEMKVALEHCILSHHGTLDMGSPIVPMTIEASAVHNADNCSAELNGFNLAIQRDSGVGAWTDYNVIYKRYIKKNCI